MFSNQVGSLVLVLAWTGEIRVLKQELGHFFQISESRGNFGHYLISVIYVYILICIIYGYILLYMSVYVCTKTPVCSVHIFVRLGVIHHIKLLF